MNYWAERLWDELLSGRKVDFYGEESRVYYDVPSRIFYVRVREGSTLLDMPIISGDEIGFLGRDGEFEYRTVGPDKPK